MTSFPFERIEVDDNLRPEEALDKYERYGFLWVRLQHPSNTKGTDDVNHNVNNSNPVFSTLQNIYSDYPEAFQRKWSIENAGKYTDEKELSSDAVLGSSKMSTNNTSNDASFLNRFYCSTIFSRKKDPNILEKTLEDCLNQYFKGAQSPPQLGDSKHQGGAWLFIGKNVNCNDSNNKTIADDQEQANNNKKQKREGQALVGRAEHVDDVTHSGTWHLQLSGCKTWILRPNVEADDWDKAGDHDDQDNTEQEELMNDKDDDKYEYGPPNLKQYLGLKSISNNTNVKVEKSDGGAVRLRCNVQEGDLFVLNTRAWYHRTEIPVDPDWSISIARDFFLPVPPVICPKDVKAGEVILEEDEIPDHFPLSSEDDEANCAMAEASSEEHCDDNNPEQDAENMIVLVALKDLMEGESFILKVAANGEDSGDDDDDEEEENAPESVDPRAISKGDWEKGVIVLKGGGIPEDLPRSMDPNCELGEDDDNYFVRSLKSIGKGDIFTIAPDSGDDMDDYEEVEVKLGTGEMERS